MDRLTQPIRLGLFSSPARFSHDRLSIRPILRTATNRSNKAWPGASGGAERTAVALHRGTCSELAQLNKRPSVSGFPGPSKSGAEAALLMTVQDVVWKRSFDKCLPLGSSHSKRYLCLQCERQPQRSGRCCPWPCGLREAGADDIALGGPAGPVRQVRATLPSALQAP